MKTNVFIISMVLGMFSLTFAQDKMFVHTTNADNIWASATYLDHPLLNDNPNAKLITSHCWHCSGLGGVDNNKITGVFYSDNTGRWMVFNEDTSFMQQYISFFVYVASDDYAFQADSGGGAYIFLDNTLINGNPGNPTVMGNFYLNSLNNYNYGLWYSEGDNNWLIFNENGGNITANTSYFVATEGEQGIAGYRHTSTAENTGLDCTRLDHPALNGNPDAKMVFTHYGGIAGSAANVTLDKVFTVFYDGIDEVWNLCTEDVSSIPAGAMFDFLIFDGSLSTPDVFAEQISLYPNPAKDVFYISGISEDSTVKIIDLNGRLIKEITGLSDNEAISTNGLTNDIYLLQIQNQGKSTTQKLIINK